VILLRLFGVQFKDSIVVSEVALITVVYIMK